MGIAVIENNNRFNIVCNNIKDRSSKSEICNSKDGKRFYKIKGFSKDKAVECIEIISKDRLEVVLTFKGVSLEDTKMIPFIIIKSKFHHSIFKSFSFCFFKIK